MASLTTALVLLLRIYDNAGVTPQEAARAAHTATAILGEARIQAEWMACPPRTIDLTGDPTGHPQCRQAALPTELIVRIATRSQPPRIDEPLGDAYVDSAAFGSMATIYLEPIRRLARGAGIDAGTLIGRAIAHEAGHLLSGTPSHALEGLMRARWTASTLRTERPGAWTFSDREARHMQSQLAARDAYGRLAHAGLIELPPAPRPCQKGRALACVGALTAAP